MTIPTEAMYLNYNITTLIIIIVILFEFQQSFCGFVSRNNSLGGLREMNNVKSVNFCYAQSFRLSG